MLSLSMYHNLLTIHYIDSRTGRIRDGTAGKVIDSLSFHNCSIYLHIIDTCHIIYAHVTSIIGKAEIIEYHPIGRNRL